VSFEVFMVKFGQWGWAGAVALVGYIWNKQDKKISDIDKAHKEFIKVEEAKKLVSEMIEPIRTEQKELKVDLKHVLTAVLEIQKEMAVQTALQKERNHSK
jgi:polyhydroxyalkanoate synthesis regulator phasin